MPVSMLGLNSGFLPVQKGERPVLGGQYPGARGRLVADELRIAGYPEDPTALGTYANRLINTNISLGTGRYTSAILPDDRGYIANILSGSWLTNNGLPLCAGILNLGGVVTYDQSVTNAASGYSTATFVQNAPGRALTFGGLSIFSNIGIVNANGAACTHSGNRIGFNDGFSYSVNNGGTWNNPNADIGFLASVNIVAGVTLTKRYGFSNTDVVNGIVTDNIGYQAPTMVGGVNNQALALNDNTTVTTTANNQGGAITVGRNSVLTLNAASALAGGCLSYEGTIAFQQAGNAIAMDSVFNQEVIYKNPNGVGSGNWLRPVLGYIDGPTFEADGATLNQTGTSISFDSVPVITAINTGSLTTTNHTALNVGGNLSAATGNTAILITRIGIKIGEFTKAGAGGTETVTNQFGIDIVKLTNGATENVGIRNAARYACTPSGSQTLAAGTTVVPDAECIQVIQTSGANITLTATPTLTNGTAARDGQRVHIVNISTVAGSTFTFQSVASLAGSNLSLGATTRIVGLKGSLTLVWDNTLTRWVEVGFNGGGNG